MDVAVGQIPLSTERISSIGNNTKCHYSRFAYCHNVAVLVDHWCIVVIWQAMQSACSQMGARTFLSQLSIDTIQHRTHGIADEIDVSTLKDYMKVNALLYSTIFVAT